MKTELRGGGTMPTSISLQNSGLFPQSSFSGQVLGGCLGSLDGACIEKLLLHCASALESNDVTLAQQVMWVLNNVASSTGDPNQRLASWFLRALISRASRICPAAMNFHGDNSTPRRLMSVTELAGYVDLIPWHRFGFCASNSAVLKAVQGCSKIHILDLSITHCMQWPTLIDALAKRPEGPPSLRITVIPSSRPPVPPHLNVSTEAVGLRLANFAKFRDLPFEFNVIDDPSSSSSSLSSTIIDPFSCKDQLLEPEILLRQLNPSTLNLRDDEALVVNCQNWIRYMSDEQKASYTSTSTSTGSSMMSTSSCTVTTELSIRDAFVSVIKDLNPHIVLVVDEDCDLSAPSLVSRITTCFNYLWIPFDALETFLPKESNQRMDLESNIGEKIENIISYEGYQRMERLECGAKLSQRMRNGGFLSVPFSEETVKEVKGLLDEHASGWGMKKEDDMLVLTWKGHNSVFATAWVPMDGINGGHGLELELELDG